MRPAAAAGGIEPMSLSNLLAEQRRLVVLQTLAEDPDRTANERVLRQMVEHLVDAASREQVRADLLWLETAGLVRVERLAAGSAGELWRVSLREDGLAVAKGREHPGVARPDLG